MQLIEDYTDAVEWDRFVESHAESRFCHLYAYSNVSRVYGYRPRRYAFVKSGRIVGVLPAVQARSLLFGCKLVSQPFSEYGGFLLDPKLGEDDVRSIVQQVRGELSGHRIPMLELHGRQGFPDLAPGAFFVAANPHHYAYLDLDAPLDEIWKNRIAYQVRKAVNKATRSGLTAAPLCDRDTIENHFYPLYVDSMRRLGVPPHRIDFFHSCHEAFGDRMKIFWARKDGKPIAGLLGFTCGRRVNIVNIVSDSHYWDLRPNDLVHWEFIKWARENDYRVFDFGPVRYEGQARYKSKWGCTVKEHGHFFLLPRESASKVATFDSSSRTMKIFSRLWSRWVPRSLGIAIGPLLRRELVR